MTKAMTYDKMRKAELIETLDRVAEERNIAIEARRRAVDKLRSAEEGLHEVKVQRDKLNALRDEAIHALLTFGAMKFPEVSLYTQGREDATFSTTPVEGLSDEARFVEHLNYILTKAV